MHTPIIAAFGVVRQQRRRAPFLPNYTRDKNLSGLSAPVREKFYLV